MELQGIVIDSGAPRLESILVDSDDSTCTSGCQLGHEAFQWYLAHLQRCLSQYNLTEENQAFWALAVPPVTQSVPDNAPHQTLMQKLTEMARLLKTDKSLTLRKLAAVLNPDAQLASGNGSYNSSSPLLGAESHQLAFVLVGWLTMLYDAAPLPPRDKLAMRILRESRAPHGVLRTRVWVADEQDIRLATQPVRYIFNKFGTLVPPPRYIQDAGRNASHGLTAIGATDLYTDYLLVTNLNYYTLSRVGGIFIELVDSLSMHLEFDERNLVLKVFRFPSYCTMLCAGNERQTFLDQFFADYFRTTDQSQDIRSVDFFAEVLWTYRLLFGQHRRSWNDFSASYASGTLSRQKNDLNDPLLARIGGSDWRKLPTFAHIQSISPQAVKSVYSAREDFPFFATRLLRLQDFIVTQNPSDLKTLRYDRRNVLQFYTFWAVAVIGGIGIILSAAQVVLSALQLWASLK